MTRTREQRSWWKRLWRGTPAPEQATEEPPPNPTPVVLGPVHERFLRELATDNAEGLRFSEIGSKPFWTSLEGLWKDGHERLASQWGEKFLVIAEREPSIEIRETELKLREQLASWYADRGEYRAAIAQLLRLTRDDSRALSSHYQLAEHFRRIGDERSALSHYEAVLARDVDYPNVQQRVRAIRAARGHYRTATSGQTLSGSQLADSTNSRYRLVRELGRGGSAAVFLAEDRELNKKVAVKLLHPHLSAKESEHGTRRFFREARITASLRHPHILAILDIEESSSRIVMELAAGGTLRHVLGTSGARTIRQVLDLHAQILSAVAAAHRQGIVHRDIKPANLMFRGDAENLNTEIMLGDFGTAHLPGQPQKKRSQQDLAGTMAYMAPGQRTGAAIDPRWDVYTTAVVLHEMLHGKLPWDKQTILSGKREPEDLQLTLDLSKEWPLEFISSLKRHISRLTSTVSARIDAEQALADATQLRDYVRCTKETRLK